MAYVVVLMTSSECPQDPTSRCVMEVIGPFDTSEQAKALGAQYPEWTNPHFMQINTPREDAT